MAAVSVTVALLVLAITGVKGPAAVVLALVAVLVAPGLAVRPVTGTTRLAPFDLAITVAVSIGETTATGLVLDAAGVSLTRTHWAEALTVLVTLTAVVAIGWRRRSPVDPGAGRAFAAEASRRRWALRVVLTAVCVALATTGGVLAWQSQQHWLSSQHFTELYARSVSGAEQVVVHNHEGSPQAYRVVISTAGAPLVVRQFTLADNGIWSQAVAVSPDAAGPTDPLLEASLYRGSSGVVYREIRLP